MAIPITPIRIPLDLKKRIQKAAEARGENLSSFVIKTMDKKTRKPTKS